MVEAIVVLGVGLLAVPITVYGNILKKRARRRAWHQAADATGLEDVVEESGYWSSDILTARAGSHRVRFEEYARTKHDRGKRIVIEGNSGLTLRAEKDVVALQRATGPRETELGDEGFDRDVYVLGDPAVLRAVLDVETRRKVRDFVQGSVWGAGRGLDLLTTTAAVQDGDVVVEIRGMDRDLMHSHFPGVLDGMLAVARHLERPASIVKRLIANTPGEPEWRVRLENLRLLAGTYPHHPATREALHRGCQDERPEVQLQSALGLDDETGQATLLEIASREGSDDPLAARAVTALGRKLPLERAQAILGHALRTRRHETARACLDALGQRGGPEVVEVLAKVMRLVKGELAVTAARALGASGVDAAEAPLLEVLKDDVGDLRLAAAQALGRVGSSAAVLALKEAAERDGGLRRAVRQAIAEIQSRIGASPGQVSLAGEGGEAGAVSLADDEPRGRVSIATRR